MGTADSVVGWPGFGVSAESGNADFGIAAESKAATPMAAPNLNGVNRDFTWLLLRLIGSSGIIPDSRVESSEVFG